MPPIVAIIGHSQSGKTTLIEKLIPEMISRGYRIATAKHTHHHIIPDEAGKDSWRHLRAGGAATVLSSPRAVMMTESTSEETGLDKVAHLLGEEYDLIIAEGFKLDPDVPKIEVHRQAAGPLLMGISNLIAVVSNESPDTMVQRFAAEDVNGLADLIEEIIIKPELVRSVIYANGVRIPLKRFISDMVANVLEGIAASLKEVGEVKSLKVFIRKK